MEREGEDGMSLKLLIAIPAYNEEMNIRAVVEDLRRNHGQHDIIIIDDGSTDQTLPLCREAEYPVISLPVHLGLTAGMQTAMQYAVRHDYDAMLQMDADGQHDPAFITAMLEAMEREKAGIVIGSRFVGKKRPRTLRMFGSTVLTRVIHMTTGDVLTDPTSGMRLYCRDILKEYADGMNYGPEPDTIAYLMRKGVKVTEVPVQMRERTAGESYFNFGRAAVYMAHMCVSILFLQWFRKRGDV